jgi:hypothetical protein
VSALEEPVIPDGIMEPGTIDAIRAFLSQWRNYLDPEINFEISVLSVEE